MRQQQGFDSTASRSFDMQVEIGRNLAMRIDAFECPGRDTAT